MPVHLVLDRPDMRAAPGSVYHAVLSLSALYWLAECQPLPNGAADIYTLSRYTMPAWLRHKSRILATLDDLLPQLAEYRRETIERKHAMAELANKALRRRRDVAKIAAGPALDTARSAPPANLLAVGVRVDAGATTQDRRPPSRALPLGVVHDHTPRQPGMPRDRTAEKRHASADSLISRAPAQISGGFRDTGKPRKPGKNTP